MTANPQPEQQPLALKLAAVEDDGEFSNLMDAGRFGHLQRVATLFSSSELVPKHFQNQPANCFIAMQMAMRMHVDPFMFMQNCYIVYGRPGLEAKLAIALVNSSGLFSDALNYEIRGGDDPMHEDYAVRAFATRRGASAPTMGPWITWDLVKAERWDQPKKEQLSKWMTMPEIMFQYRAAMFFARLHCPERLMGMQTVDELEDVEPAKTVKSTVVEDPKTFTKTKRLAAKFGVAEAVNTSTGEVANPDSQLNPAVDTGAEANDDRQADSERYAQTSPSKEGEAPSNGPEANSAAALPAPSDPPLDADSVEAQLVKFCSANAPAAVPVGTRRNIILAQLKLKTKRGTWAAASAREKSDILDAIKAGEWPQWPNPDAM